MLQSVDYFPLYKDDGIIAVKLANNIKENVYRLRKAIEAGQLKLVQNHCLCKNLHPESDVVISEKDRYGLPIPQVLCSKCGLVRSGLVFDEESNILFYKDYYRTIYNIKQNVPVDKIFEAHKDVAAILYNNIKKNINLLKIHNIAEIGCSCGFNLELFRQEGAETVGYDYNKEYLNYGRSKGLDLRYGDFCEQSAVSSYDLIILNHVFEHLLDPIGELKKIISKLRVNGYLYIEVPGIYSLKGTWGRPLLYFQNAHVYYFYEEYLKKLLSFYGLRVIYSNERCTFICQKIVEIDFEKINEFECGSSLNTYVGKNLQYFIKCEADWKKSWYIRHRKAIKGYLHPIICLLGWRKIRHLVKSDWK